MKHLTKIFVIIASIIFVVGMVFQVQGEESSAIKLFVATILFMLCAFISRHNDQKK
ncbi:membrane protein [Staphylococcus microti]|uniref:Membrane protein n=1 Tax=Staphylococcus microti TaxID=569857 RepID=A0A0D6XNZ1_9STAP|nr:hypothetical protein [Staphylococcus microti]KIX90499.1 membrane protein [Staphylococcus microti]SUM57963.1 membrane protein [Staphylococcus microti]